MAGGLLARSRRKRAGRYAHFSEINVTPFVDVMLVLLIVFMISAPLLTTGITIDLPESEAKALSEQNNAPLEVSLEKGGKIFIGESEVTREKFIPLLKAIMKQKDDKRIYIKADKELSYANVMDVLGAVNNAGFSKVSLVSEPAL